MFIFSRRSQGGLLEIGERKKPQPASGLKINAKMNVTFLFILSVRRADGPGHSICPDLTADS